MSEQRDTTWQECALPKSLRGTEDADLVWNMITERFPSAAPLLCEMEAVIERAEDLLQQLRAPSHREIALETSTSFCALDSEDSVSLMSAQDFLADENSEAGSKGTKKAVAETQISESSIYESETLVCPVLDGNSELSGEKIAKGDKNVDTPATSKPEKHPSKATKEAKSLEQWEEAISSSLGEHVEKVKESEMTLPPQGEHSDVGDSTENQDENSQNQEARGHVKDASASLKGCGDESPSTFSSRRKPLEILEEYASRCKVPVVYQNDEPHRHRSGVYVIRGNLGGFAATSRGDSEESAKNSLAVKILRMLADHQMNDEKFASLSDLAKNEMQEIIDLGVGDERQSAQAKLYRLCLEQAATVPEYSIEKIKTYQGFTYVATCNALGLVGEGRGVRECVAKKAAAEDLCRQYSPDLKL